MDKSIAYPVAHTYIETSCMGDFCVRLKELYAIKREDAEVIWHIIDAYEDIKGEGKTREDNELK